MNFQGLASSAWLKAGGFKVWFTGLSVRFRGGLVRDDSLDILRMIVSL